MKLNVPLIPSVLGVISTFDNAIICEELKRNVYKS